MQYFKDVAEKIHTELMRDDLDNDSKLRYIEKLVVKVVMDSLHNQDVQRQAWRMNEIIHAK